MWKVERRNARLGRILDRPTLPQFLEPEHQETFELCVVQKRRETDLEARQLRKGRSWCCESVRKKLKHSIPPFFSSFLLILLPSFISNQEPGARHGTICIRCCTHKQYTVGWEKDWGGICRRSLRDKTSPLRVGNEAGTAFANVFTRFRIV